MLIKRMFVQVRPDGTPINDIAQVLANIVGEDKLGKREIVMLESLGLVIDKPVQKPLPFPHGFKMPKAKVRRKP